MAFELNLEMEEALTYIETTRRNIFLTGNAGTGKTTFLKMLRDGRCNKNMVVLAPTGVAAINAKGQTIHSFFQFPMSVFTPERIKEFKDYKMDTTKRALFGKIDLIVIDEISMVRADLLDAIDYRMRQLSKFKGEPFGGAQLLMIGDLQQLPPVVTGDDEALLAKHYQTNYFFGSHALMQASFVTISLSKIYRQQDPRFINILNSIRDGNVTNEVLDDLNSRYVPAYKPKDEEEVIRLCTHNKTVDELNEKKLAELKTKLYTYESSVEGEFPTANYPVSTNLELKEGAQVMFLKNNFKQNIFNGKIGRVTKLTDDSVTVKCNGDDSPIEVERYVWENMKFVVHESTGEIEGKVVGTFAQYPLRLAWAVSVHKSQGLTFDKAYLDINDAFSHGQVYVALSRCRSLEGLYLKAPLRKGAVMSDLHLRFFMEAERQRSIEEKKNLPQLQKEYYLNLYRELFTFADITTSLMHLTGDIIGGGFEKIYPEAAERMQDLSNQFIQKVGIVASNFEREYVRNIEAAADVRTDEVLLSRSKSAAHYFLGQLRALDSCVMMDNYEIDNTEISDMIIACKTRYLNSVYQKTKILEEVEANGFTTARYLELRRMIDVELEGGKPKLKKAETSAAETQPTEMTYSQSLFKLLSNWRRKKAGELGIPVYMVFNQITLQLIASKMPTSGPELLEINGVSKDKLDKYGAELIEIIDDFMAENPAGPNDLIDLSLPTKKKAAVKRENTDDSAKPKRKSGETYQITLDLLTQGKTITEIAAERSLSVQTISMHAEKLMFERRIDLFATLPKKQQQSLMEKVTRIPDITRSQYRMALGSESPECLLAAAFYAKAVKDVPTLLTLRAEHTDLSDEEFAAMMIKDDHPIFYLNIALSIGQNELNKVLEKAIEKGLLKETDILSREQYELLKAEFARQTDTLSIYLATMHQPYIRCSLFAAQLAKRRYESERS